MLLVCLFSCLEWCFVVIIATDVACCVIGLV